MSGYKRKRSSFSSDAHALAVFRPYATPYKKARSARSRVVPGITRTGGYYGRYAYGKGKQGELKFFDTALSFQVDTSLEVPATGQLSLIPQGVTESERVGRKCVIKSIQIEGIAALTPAASATTAVLSYIWIVLDKQANGAVATASGAGGVFTSTVAGSALRELSNQTRFRILKKIVIPNAPMAGVSAAFNSAVKSISCYLKCNIPLEFNAATGAITEIRSNNIFLLAGSAGSGVQDDLVTVTGNARLRFADN